MISTKSLLYIAIALALIFSLDAQGRRDGGGHGRISRSVRAGRDIEDRAGMVGKHTSC